MHKNIACPKLRCWCKYEALLSIDKKMLSTEPHKTITVTSLAREHTRTPPKMVINLFPFRLTTQILGDLHGEYGFRRIFFFMDMDMDMVHLEKTLHTKFGIVVPMNAFWSSLVLASNWLLINGIGPVPWQKQRLRLIEYAKTVHHIKTGSEHSTGALHNKRVRNAVEYLAQADTAIMQLGFS